MEHQKNFDKDPKEKEFVEKLVTLNRTCKTVKGGRRMSFSALTVVGDGKGRVGYGLGKANDVSEAIKKSIDRAKRNLVVIPMKNGTLPHEIIGKYKSSEVLTKSLVNTRVLKYCLSQLVPVLELSLVVLYVQLWMQLVQQTFSQSLWVLTQQ